MQNLIKTITNRYFKTMIDKRFHIYLSESKMNICWIRSASDAGKNYFKTYDYSKKGIKNLLKWMTVETGFPQAKIKVKIEAPLNNQQDLVRLLKKSKTNLSVNQIS